jgi:hypothetical protein
LPGICDEEGECLLSLDPSPPEEERVLYASDNVILPGVLAF